MDHNFSNDILTSINQKNSNTQIEIEKSTLMNKNNFGQVGLNMSEE